MVHPCEQSYEVFPELIMETQEAICNPNHLPDYNLQVILGMYMLTPNSVCGDKRPETLSVRYWHGAGDKIYTQVVGSKCYSERLMNEDGSEAHPIEDFFRGLDDYRIR